MKQRTLNGYTLIYEPDHPSSMKSENWYGWIYEHIYIAELTIGRRLREDECVHHLDFNKENNRPDNLVVLTRRAHRQIHSWLNSGAPGYDQSLAGNSGKVKTSEKNYRCKTCGGLITGQGKIYCSSSCIERRVKLTIEPQELQELVWQEPMTKIAARFGVSDRAIKKRCEKLGIKLPPRGFWAVRMSSK